MGMPDLGHAFRDPALLEAALTHASTTTERLASNERLEFLGDAVLGLSITHALFERHPDWPEGRLTAVKSEVVSRRHCARVAEAIGLPDLIRLGKGMRGEKLPDSVTGSALEAVIAAIYLDAGFEAARAWILPRFAEVLAESAASARQNNWKGLLQELCMQALGRAPDYLVLRESGPDHDKRFEVAVQIGARRFPAAVSRSKKDAEQQAAFLAMETLGILVGGEAVPQAAELLQQAAGR